MEVLFDCRVVRLKMQRENVILSIVRIGNSEVGCLLIKSGGDTVTR
jgi:hypothetical protein